MKPNPNPCHHVYYGGASSALMGALAIGLSKVLGLSMPFRHHAIITHTGVRNTYIRRERVKWRCNEVKVNGDALKGHEKTLQYNEEAINCDSEAIRRIPTKRKLRKYLCINRYIQSTVTFII